MEYRHYNTGDQVWLYEGNVCKVITHDGIIWQGSSRRLNGISKVFNFVKVFLIQLYHKVV